MEKILIYFSEWNLRSYFGVEKFYLRCFGLLFEISNLSALLDLIDSSIYLLLLLVGEWNILRSVLLFLNERILEWSFYYRIEDDLSLWLRGWGGEIGTETSDANTFLFLHSISYSIYYPSSFILYPKSYAHPILL